MRELVSARLRFVELLSLTHFYHPAGFPAMDVLPFGSSTVYMLGCSELSVRSTGLRTMGCCLRDPPPELSFHALGPWPAPCSHQPATASHGTMIICHLLGGYPGESCLPTLFSDKMGRSRASGQHRAPSHYDSPDKDAGL
jgi:hypothetical protein